MRSLIFLSKFQLESLFLQGFFFKENFSFQKNYLYFFYESHKIFGIYQYKYSLENLHHFSRDTSKSPISVSPQNLQTIQNKGDIYLLYFFKKFQQKRFDLYIKVQITKKFYKIYFCSCIAKELIVLHTIPKEEIFSILSFFNNSHQYFFKTNDYFVLLQKYGKELFQKIFPIFIQKNIDLIKKIFLQGAISLPLFHVICHKKRFICETIPILHHVAPYKKSFTQKKPSIFLKDFALLTCEGTPFYKEEAQGILEIFQKFPTIKNIFLSHDVLTENHIQNIFESTDWVHFTGHGKIDPQAGIQLKNDIFFPWEKIRTFQKVPQILVLSCCMCVDMQFLDIFFQKGGEVILFFSQKISGQYLPQLFKNFYQNILEKEKSLETAIMFFQKQCVSNKIFEVGMLQAAGNTKMKIQLPLKY